MKNKILGAVGGAMLLVPFIPAMASAQTYHYITMTGEVRDIEANSSIEAMAIMNANGDALHSGVAADQGVLEDGDIYATVFQYVDVNGNLKTVTAATVDAAFVLATDIAPHSGVAAVAFVRR